MYFLLILKEIKMFSWALKLLVDLRHWVTARPMGKLTGACGDGGSWGRGLRIQESWCRPNMIS